jgi:hypothetical protein
MTAAQMIEYITSREEFAPLLNNAAQYAAETNNASGEGFRAWLIDLYGMTVFTQKACTAAIAIVKEA